MTLWSSSFFAFYSLNLCTSILASYALYNENNSQLNFNRLGDDISHVHATIEELKWRIYVCQHP